MEKLKDFMKEKDKDKFKFKFKLITTKNIYYKCMIKIDGQER